MHVQSCCFAYSTYFFVFVFSDVHVTVAVAVAVAVAVVASFHTNAGQHLVSSFWFSLIIKEVSGDLR